MKEADYETGNPDEDLKTKHLMRQLLFNPKLQAACPLPFDEAKLWKGRSGPELKQQIQKQFRNIRSGLYLFFFFFYKKERNSTYSCVLHYMLLINFGFSSCLDVVV